MDRTSSTMLHPDAAREIVASAIPDDEDVWVPQAPGVWFRPLLLNRTSGMWCSLLRVRRAGILSRHRHPAPVHGLVLKGSWRYLEHDWIATPGSFVFEPPGEVHTLVVDGADEEMITFFQVTGLLLYVDHEGAPTGFEDVFTKIEMCRRHYAGTPLGARYVDRYVR
ncbi:2,4'-dihydroxyacetophenone dioxygenase family protein [Arenibaculum sp.]|uniref:2,4'-dihydroxyacetophenone dioxygenase family protein n=1 Tax=Arenibaculum sp. TaxID=2865862 RepID=UPI002E10589D|nr:2,4'-dihydroxyacetophenone dioxygenase family protein [Arenibaculum sp.]